MSAVAKLRMTPAEYLAWEEGQEEKHEYQNGHVLPVPDRAPELYAMAGGSLDPGRIARNVLAALHERLRGSGCEPFGSDVSVRVADGFVYPDGFVVCGDIETEERAVLNPAVVFEVLSPSSEAYDRGDKFARYRPLASLREYVLIDQGRRRIDTYRLHESGYWMIAETVTAGALELATLNVALDLGDVYAGVGAR